MSRLELVTDNSILMEDYRLDPRSSIPNDLKVMRLKIMDLRDMLKNPIAVEALQDQLPALDAIATDILELMHEVTND